jgi:hypothetical protein
MRRRGEKFDPHALPLLPGISQVDDPAFQLFLRLRVADNQHLPILHFMLQEQQTAVGIHDHGFAGLPEFAAIMAASLRLYAHLVKGPRAAPRRCRCDFAHNAIFKRAPHTVNGPAVQVFPIRNPAVPSAAGCENTHLSGMSISSYKDINYLKRLRPCQAQPYPLFSEDFFHLADFLLDFPAYLFANTFGF